MNVGYLRSCGVTKNNCLDDDDDGMATVMLVTTVLIILVALYNNNLFGMYGFYMRFIIIFIRLFKYG